MSIHLPLEEASLGARPGVIQHGLGLMSSIDDLSSHDQKLQLKNALLYHPVNLFSISDDTSTQQQVGAVDWEVVTTV